MLSYLHHGLAEPSVRDAVHQQGVVDVESRRSQQLVRSRNQT